MARNAETNTQNEILLAIGGRPDVLAWRQQVGMFRAMENPDRLVRVGVPGMADIGMIVEVVITPDMVGRRVGVAVQVEAKAGRGQQRDNQRRWESAVHQRGGVYAVSRSAGEIVEIVQRLPLRIISGQ